MASRKKATTKNSFKLTDLERQALTKYWIRWQECAEAVKKTWLFRFWAKKQYDAAYEVLHDLVVVIAGEGSTLFIENGQLEVTKA